MIDLEILRTFIAVVDQGSVVGASRICGFTPSAVSRQMSGFQRRLGVTLFEPDGRGIRPTPIAYDISARARLLLEESVSFEAQTYAMCRNTPGARTSA